MGREVWSCSVLCVGRDVWSSSVLCVGRDVWNCRVLCVGDRWGIVGYFVCVETGFEI